MRRIIITTFMTMDGVMQAPGHPDEDRANGFKWGGWQFNYSDEIAGNAIVELMSAPFGLLLGHRTYEIFASYWPHHNDDPIGEKFNRITKYVVATTPIITPWKNSIVINKNVVNELRKLKEQDAPDLLVHGSSQLVQTLLANHLVDVLHLWTYPLTIGHGKKLFQEGTPTQEWKLTKSVITTRGVFIATYLPGDDVKSV